MNRLRARLVPVAFGVLLAAGTSGPARAQDPAAVNAKSVHVALENDRVRVMDVLLPPGGRELVHSHPAHVIYVIAGGTTRDHTVDGRSVEAVLRPGDVLYREPLTHWAENVGTTPIRLVLVELKAAP